MDLNPVVIHLDHAIERNPIIDAMESALAQPIRIHRASDGARWNDPDFVRVHVNRGTPVKRGAVGCFDSHMAVLDEFKESADEYRLILEDDTIFYCSADTIREYIEEADRVGPWDMLYIGASKYSRTTPLASDKLLRVDSAFGTYAMLLKRSAIPKLDLCRKAAKKSGNFHPSDWIYLLATERFNLIAYGPIKNNALCWYSTGIYSYVVEEIRMT